VRPVSVNSNPENPAYWVRRARSATFPNGWGVVMASTCTTERYVPDRSEPTWGITGGRGMVNPIMSRKSFRRWVAAVAVFAVTATPVPAAADPGPPGPPEVPAEPMSGALAKLEALAIKGRAPKTGYDRDRFGDRWTDDVAVAGGRNGCDTRNDILRRDLIDLVIKPGSNGCVVLSGVLNDPFTGTSVGFVRGRGTSQEVQIDHVVALSDAWQKGAAQWDEATRRDFANDPANLQATIGWVNQQKGDGDAATWLPPNTAYRCTYVTRIVDIKAAYGLWVTQAEHDAMERVLAGCA